MHKSSAQHFRVAMCARRAVRVILRRFFFDNRTRAADYRFVRLRRFSTSIRIRYIDYMFDFLQTCGDDGVQSPSHSCKRHGAATEGGSDRVGVGGALPSLTQSPKTQAVPMICPVCLNDGAVGVAPSGVSRQLPGELRKLVISYAYMMIVSFMECFATVLVHIRLPDPARYPPLPDMVLDHLPFLPWAFQAAEATTILMFVGLVTVCLFHKHR